MNTEAKNKRYNLLLPGAAENIYAKAAAGVSAKTLSLEYGYKSSSGFVLAVQSNSILKRAYYDGKAEYKKSVAAKKAAMEEAKHRLRVERKDAKLRAQTMDEFVAVCAALRKKIAKAVKMRSRKRYGYRADLLEWCDPIHKRRA